MIAILKGSTVADALRAMDMEADHHRVEHELSGEVLEANDNLFELLEENESLTITPHFDAGGSAGR